MIYVAVAARASQVKEYALTSFQRKLCFVTLLMYLHILFLWWYFVKFEAKITPKQRYRKKDAQVEEPL